MLMRWIVGISLALSACASDHGCQRSTIQYDRARVSAVLDAPENGVDPSLVLGEFPLAPNAIVDGDTIKVGGLDASLRLLAIDTEETFKSDQDLRLYEQGWEHYLATKQAETDKPIKSATPMGMKAKKFAEDFFRGVARVRLERDHPKDLRDVYDRHLVYVFVEKDGTWVNYNVEAVRAGMSPYFTKYGFSRRFHQAFVEAQDEARKAKRGIWDPDEQHYPDYDLRLRWWNARARFIEKFEKLAAGRDDHIVLTHWDAVDRLAAAEGQEVRLLGNVGRIYPARGRAPTRVLLTKQRSSSVPLIFFDDEVFENSRIAEAVGELVVVRGTVSTYRARSKRGKGQAREQLQIVIRLPEQIVVSETAPHLFATREPSTASPAEAPPAQPPTDPSPEAPVDPP